MRCDESGDLSVTPHIGTCRQIVESMGAQPQPIRLDRRREIRRATVSRGASAGDLLDRSADAHAQRLGAVQCGVGSPALLDGFETFDSPGEGGEYGVYFGAGEWRSDAAVNTATEPEMIAGIAGDIESIRILEPTLVSIAGSDQHEHT
jgi:hypothetical protein